MSFAELAMIILYVFGMMLMSCCNKLTIAFFEASNVKAELSRTRHVLFCLFWPIVTLMILRDLSEADALAKAKFELEKKSAQCKCDDCNCKDDGK